MLRLDGHWSEVNQSTYSPESALSANFPSNGRAMQGNFIAAYVYRTPSQPLECARWHTSNTSRIELPGKASSLGIGTAPFERNQNSSESAPDWTRKRLLGICPMHIFKRGVGKR
jgi:hypothetical protein